MQDEQQQTMAAGAIIPADPMFALDGRAAEEQASEAMREKIRATIAWRLRDAISARETSGIEDIWIEDADQYDGYDALNPAPAGRNKPAEEPRQGTDTSQVSKLYINITEPKVDTAVSRVQEMLLPHDDRPWEVAPTPVPSLNDAAATDDGRTVTLADGQPAKAQDVARALLIKASSAAEKMTDQLEDWWVEHGVYSAARDVVRHAAKSGTGILKGPFPVSVSDRRWDVVDGVGVMEIVERITPSAKTVRCWDFYPDPSCGEDINNGGYVFERDYITARSLRKLAKLPDYDRAAIAQVLAEGPMRLTRTGNLPPEKQGETQQQDRAVFEVFYYYGDIEPEALLSTGYTIPGLNDAKEPERLAAQVDQALQLATVDVCCMVINERIVRVTMNPLETGEFPYSVLPWQPVEGQIWGKSAVRRLAAPQKVVNNGTRAMMENAAITKGPQIIANRKLIKPVNGRWEITGRKLWWNMSDEAVDGRFLFQSVSVDSSHGELMNIVKFGMEMADVLSNLPMMMQGQVGTAPDTLGGLRMLEANASSPLKAIAKLIDDRLINPLIKRYYAWAMQDPNVPAEAKGDMQCRAIGSQALARREQAAMFLQQSAPLVKDPSFRINPQRWFEFVARANRVSPTTIQYTDDEWRAVQEQNANNVPQDPRVQAAQIMQQTRTKESEDKLRNAEAERQFRAQQAERDRWADEVTKRMDLEIEAMQLASSHQLSADQIRAALTKAIIDSRDRRELFAAEASLKRDPSNETHEGI